MFSFYRLIFITAIFFSGCSKAITNEKMPIVKTPPLPIKTQTSVSKSSAPIPPLLPKKSNLLIGIDAGHGGKDQGAESKTAPKIQEKDLTLTTAKILESYLREYGYKTILIRKDDTFIDLSDRAKFANEKKCDLFVSVHFNAAENLKADGIEVYYYKSEKSPKRSTESKKLASYVLDDILSKTKGKSRGTKHGNFAVIRETKMPAILVEGGFLTNCEEMNKIKKLEYRKEMARGIALGVRRYINNSEIEKK